MARRISARKAQEDTDALQAEHDLYAAMLQEAVDHKLWEVLGLDVEAWVAGFAERPLPVIAEMSGRKAKVSRPGADREVRPRRGGMRTDVTMYPKANWGIK
jgi:hypothetical protein